MSSNKFRRIFVLALFALAVVSMTLSMPVQAQDKPIKIGYVVKHLDNPWFVSETGGAKDLAKKMGVDLTIQDVQFDTNLALSTMDTMIASGVSGFLIVVPEQKVGPAVMEKAAKANLPLIAIDDEISDAAGNPAPFAGFDAASIGKQVATMAVEQYKAKGWAGKSGVKVGAINIEFASLDVCRTRTDASTATWKALLPDFPAAQIIVSPYDGTLNNAITTFADNITAHPDITNWVLWSCNDDGVLGAVRALEQAKVPAENIIGIGLGAHLACDEWAKPKKSGFSGAIFIRAASHGEFALAAMYNHLKYGIPIPLRTISPGVPVTPDGNYKSVLGST